MRPLIIIVWAQNMTATRNIWQGAKPILDSLSPTKSTVNVLNGQSIIVQANPTMHNLPISTVKSSNKTTSNDPVNIFIEV
jgi:hypothetical protein